MSIPHSASLFPNSFLDKELGISALPTPCLGQHLHSSARAKNHQIFLGLQLLLDSSENGNDT